MTYSVKPNNEFIGKLAWWVILMGVVLCIIVWCSYFDELKKHEILIEQSHRPVYFVKHSNDEVEKTNKDVEKYFYAVTWKGKFGIKHYNYYQAVIDNIAEIIEYHGYKRNEYGVKISLLVDGNGEYFVFLQMKLYKTGYKGQFYTEWYVSERGSKASPNIKLPDIPFREPREPSGKTDNKPEPKDDFENFKPEPKGKTIYI